MSFFLYGRPRFYYQIVYEYGGEIIFEKKNPLYIMELLPDNKKVDAGLLLNWLTSLVLVIWLNRLLLL